MTKKAICREAAAVVSVVLVLVGIPLLLWYWRSVVVPGRYAPGTKIFQLTALGDRGIWTEQPVVGYDYWWRNPARVNTLRVNQGDHVALLLRSPDVQHSFIMRDLHIGPVPVSAGHTVEVKFDVNTPSELEFLCGQVCGRDHTHMKGSVLVAARGGRADKPLRADLPAMPHVHHNHPEQQ
jgi:heme/copper-type cytochrome/quinol oxidase subunit 2